MTTEAFGDLARPMRPCDACGQVDNHPRHVWDHPPGGGATPADLAEAMIARAPEEYRGLVEAHVRDDRTTMRHMDCCREAGCPDGTCDTVTAGAEELKGSDLVEHIQTNFAAPTEQDGE